MWYVDLIESERGFGQKKDSTKAFKTLEEAEAFVKEFNSINDKPYVPAWYMYAKGPYQIPHVGV